MVLGPAGDGLRPIPTKGGASRLFYVWSFGLAFRAFLIAAGALGYA